MAKSRYRSLQTTGAVAQPLPHASAATIDGSAFISVTPTDPIPVTWDERARRAWTYYIEEPLVKNCVNSWRCFAVGDEIKLASDDEMVKDGVCELHNRLALSTFIKDMILQLLVKGDAVGYKRYSQDGRDIEEITCVNPTSVKVKYAQGTLVEMQQYPEDAPAAGDGLSLPIEQVIHLRWDAPPFSPRGNSLVLPAFQSIELLRDYRKAEQAIAKRWATPFRLIKVGGAFNQRVITPDQKMLQDIRDMVNKMDMKSGLVVPFYVGVETHGAEGSVLNVEEKVKEVKEDIIVGLGLARSLVTGDGPNFATASVSMQKMLVMIREIKQIARQLLDWVVDDWLTLSGHENATVQYLFNDLDPNDAVDIKKLLLELYDRKLISRSSLQAKMELDPAVEAANRTQEKPGIDVLDEKQAKPIVDMVTLGVLDVDEARSFLGLGPKTTTPAAAAALAMGGPAARAFAEDALCDECRQFDAAENHCAVQGSETTFDARACRFFDRK
ncbi:MAG: phage portal protein family protein [Armatimonadota bacterium]